ncbi:unnamed protein product, partial [Prunus brigantina]
DLISPTTIPTSPIPTTPILHLLHSSPTRRTQIHPPLLSNLSIYLSLSLSLPDLTISLHQI